MASGSMAICTIEPELLQKLQRFNFKKDKVLSAIVMKINMQAHEIIFEEEFEDVTIEDLTNELPAQQPRYVALSYPLKHDDGRVSYPLLFIYISSQDCKPEMHMMYAGSKTNLVKEGKFTKVMEFRSVDEVTVEAVEGYLKKLR